MRKGPNVELHKRDESGKRYPDNGPDIGNVVQEEDQQRPSRREIYT